VEGNICHISRKLSPDWEKPTTGAKARKSSWRSNAALEGPLFHSRASSPPTPQKIETSLRTVRLSEPTHHNKERPPHAQPRENRRMHNRGRTAACSSVEEPPHAVPWKSRRFSAASSAPKRNRASAPVDVFPRHDEQHDFCPATSPDETDRVWTAHHEDNVEASVTNPRTTVEERTLQRRVKPPKENRASAPVDAVRSLEPGCPTSRVLCETWDSAPPFLKGFSSATTGKGTTSAAPQAKENGTSPARTPLFSGSHHRPTQYRGRAALQRRVKPPQKESGFSPRGRFPQT
jgi:hypothetical protein